MIRKFYEPYHQAILNLGGREKGRLRLGGRVMITRVQHEESTKWHIPLNRDFELRDKNKRPRGHKTFFIPYAHAYTVETPAVRPIHQTVAAEKIEETIKKHLHQFRESLSKRAFLRLAVDVEPLKASSINKNRTLWRVIISELIDPRDIPDST